MSATRGLSQASGDEIYEVERILKKRNHPTKGVLYFVKWRNYPNSANTWEPACNFSQKLIEIYEAKHRRGRKSLSTTNKTTTSSSSPSISSSSIVSEVSNTSTATDLYSQPENDSNNDNNNNPTEHLIPSTSLAVSSLSSTTITISSNSNLVSQDQPVKSRGRGRPRKNSTQRRQQQVQLQMDIQEKQQKTQMPVERQQLAVFNPVGNHYLPIVKEVVYEPELTKEPIMVTDVTTRHLTVTISECLSEAPEGFFRK